MKNTYHLLDRDDDETYGIFKSSLNFDAIEQIQDETEKEYEKPNSTYKTEIFFDLLKAKDPNYEPVHIQEIYI